MSAEPPVNGDPNLNEPKRVEVEKSGQISSSRQLDENHPESDPNKTGTEEKMAEQPPEKVREPIFPYKVGDSYQDKLMAALKKQGKIRPTTVLEEEIVDRTEADEILIQKEEARKKKLKYEIENALTIEKDENLEMQKYKEYSLNGQTLLQDPLALLYNAKKLYIDQYYKISDFFVLCPLYYNYRISVQYSDDTPPYFLFQTNEISPSCGHTFCSNQSRAIKINIDNFIIKDEKSNENSDDEKLTQTFLYIRKAFRCAVSCFCGCCSRPTFYVESPYGKFGKIVEKRTIGDPILEVFDINDDLIYIISCKGCACGFCCADTCCGSQKCANCEFFIFDEKKSVVLGRIFKNHRFGKKMAPDYDQIEVDFPEECSCQNKALLLSGALAITYLYYQHNSNSNRCCGNPEYKASIH